MGRLAWSQVRFRPARTLALIAGVLVAATGFTVLTAASRTAQLRTVGTVSAHFVPAYDILVRPRGARTAVENRTGTVQPDFLSGIYGGITMAQYHQIQQIPGVQVAAPIAMVGYAQLEAAIFEPVPAAALAGSGRQLYRISTTWVSGNGASRVAQPPSYLYVTPLRLTGGYNYIPPTDGTGPGCMLMQDRPPSPGTKPFGTAAQSYTGCWSRVNQYDLPGIPHTERRLLRHLDHPGADRGHRPGRRGETGRAEQGACLRRLPEGERGRQRRDIAGTGLLRQRHGRVRADHPAAAHGTVCDA